MRELFFFAKKDFVGGLYLCSRKQTRPNTPKYEEQILFSPPEHHLYRYHDHRSAVRRFSGHLHRTCLDSRSGAGRRRHPLRRTGPTVQE